jgi:hypothetical protein
MAKERILGIVQNGLLRRLTPVRDLGIGCRLTRDVSGKGPPEQGEIDLARYGGNAILVEGEPAELWAHSANVVEEAGPIVTELVQYVLGLPDLPLDPKPPIAL